MHYEIILKCQNQYKPYRDTALKWQIRYTGLYNMLYVKQGRAETFGGAGAQNIKGAHETRL